MHAVMSTRGYMVARLPSTSVAPVVRSRSDLAMERYAEGDREAGDQVYELLRSRLYAIGFQWSRSASVAEDLVQDTFLKLTEARGTFRRGGRVLPWACAMARNLLTDGHRRRTFEQWVLEAALRREAAAAEVGPPGDERPDQRRRLEAALAELDRLPAPQRDVFLLIRVEGLSVKQAARRLGITEGMVKIRTFRAAAALRAADERRKKDE